MSGHSDPRSNRELALLAFSCASHGGEPKPVHDLRQFTHAEMMAGRIDGATQDRIGELIDQIAELHFAKVDDVIGHGAAVIPWDVLEFVDCEGDRWRRAFGADRYRRDDDTPDTTEEYDWLCGHGAASTTEGCLYYTPLRVTRVACGTEEEMESKP